MSILVEAIEHETPSLLKNNVRLRVIGDTDSLPEEVRNRLFASIDKTSNNTGVNLILALSYSARWEIIKASKEIAENVGQGLLKEEDINEDLFASYLTTKEIPDPELMIRTSGETRISNFLLWQIAYSELYFTDIYWPDFNKEELCKALYSYQNRERRFGKTSEQIQEN